MVVGRRADIFRIDAYRFSLLARDLSKNFLAVFGQRREPDEAENAQWLAKTRGTDQHTILPTVPSCSKKKKQGVQPRSGLHAYGWVC